MTERAANEKEMLKDLWPGQSVALLKALHILTHNGGLNADSRRKLKQVQHLAQLIKPAIDAALKEKAQPVLADLGAGKSYLGFILYDLYFGPAGRGKVIAVEARAELIATAKKIAAESGFDRMEFVHGKIAEAQAGPVDIVTALHACDTATDEAILFALKHDAKYVALVPCCQAELAHEPGRGEKQYRPALAPSHSPPGAGLSPDQCAARPVPGGAWLQGAGDGIHRPGTFAQE